MKKRHHYLLWGLGLAGGGYLAYRFGYKPWAAQRAAAAAAGGSSALPPPTYAPSYGGAAGGVTYIPAGIQPPTVANAVSAPTTLPLPSITTAGPNTSLGPTYTGPVGACIKIKGSWSPQQCQNRLDQLTQAFNNARQWISGYQATVGQTQATLAANQTALAGAQQAYNAALNNNDAAGAQAWLQAIQGHQDDIGNLTRALAALPGQLAAFQAQAAANDNDYFNLTQQHLA